MTDTNPQQTDQTALAKLITDAVQSVLPMSSSLACAVVADAVLAVLPEAGDRAAILRAEAEHLIRDLYPAVYDDAGQKTALGVNRAARELLDRADADELRRAAASGPGGVADETRQPVPADRPAIRAAAFDEAAAKLAGLDPVKAALAGQHAWNVAAGIVRHMAVQERRMADGEQQPETQADDGPRCTCADAGPAFAPAGHYADCPQAEQPAVEHCIHDRTVHRTHHKQAPVTGCPWCTAATSTED